MTAKAVFRPDLYDAALGHDGTRIHASHAVGAFAGPAFDADDIAGHLAAFRIGRKS
jgi:NitT/TauT family transport system ATP-binding protein